MIDMEILQATGIGSHTLVGFDDSKGYPLTQGNCFSVCTVEDRLCRIVNFSHENFIEAVARGVKLPISIGIIGKNNGTGEGYAIVHDKRISVDWYQQRWCEICCPEDLLPLPQRLAHALEIEQGVRIQGDGFIKINYAKKPTLEKRGLRNETD